MLAVLGQIQAIDTVSIGIAWFCFSLFVEIFHHGAVFIEENGGNIGSVDFFGIFEMFDNLLLFVYLFILFGDSAAQFEYLGILYL